MAEHPINNPPAEFSLMPFWFWNDALTKGEILRQIADFTDHGVHGFVIHPRVGLPREIGWMSDALLEFMRVAIEEAARRGMKVILYDEGMYPSGSSSGQVVAADAKLACRCFALLNGELPNGANVVARVRRKNGEFVTVIDRRADTVIRGLHYLDETTGAEDEPAAGDILNPRTAEAVLRLVYERFFESFGEHFGKTIIGIFTDEPNPLGRLREKNVWAGTTGILADISRRVGYDFEPHLPALWFDEEEGAARYRRDYQWAIHRRLEETWYRPLSKWCSAHGVALCGHPDRGDEIGVQKWFGMPGQDLVWRWVLPDHPTALEGPESTQGKCSSSAMVHLGRRRNSNEFCGAYGHETTFEEFKWLADWCLVRGVNLLIPHAFYYSVRGPRRDERPPQVGGVGCAWWEKFKPLADHCRRLCWVNTDSQHVCEVAILTGPDHCPWRAAKACFEGQWDFNYLDADALSGAEVDEEGVHLAGMLYRAVIVDGEVGPAIEKLGAMSQAGRVLRFSEGRPEELEGFFERNCTVDVVARPPVKGLRVRHVVKEAEHFYLLFNENGVALKTNLQLAAKGVMRWINTTTGEMMPAAGPDVRLDLAAYGVALLTVEAE